MPDRHRASERLTFEGSGGNRLAARLERPAGTPRAYALFAHCFTCSKDLKAMARLSRSLAERGIAVLRFDFTGLGESEGDFAGTNFSSNLDDLRAAARFLRDELAAPQLLIGHSLGGAAVLAMAADVPEARAVATIGAPSDTTHLRDTLLRAAPDLEDEDEVEVTLAGRSFRIRRQLLDDLAESRLQRAIRELGTALLVMHSPIDDEVGIEHARRIFELAQHPKSFISLDDADHLLLQREADARYAAEVLAAWADRYLDAPVAEANEKEEETPAEGEVWVRGGAAGLTQRIRAGHHTLVADEPLRAGGDDRGPTPYDLLLAGLGACTAMTLQMYSRHKGWELESVDVRLRHEKIHARDCEDCETEKGRLDLIERRIAVAGELSEAQRERLMEIADRCPVHRTLTSETKIRSERL